MTTSGLSTFNLSNGGLIFEAFDRIGKRPPQIDRHMMMSARNSINLVFIDWEDDGFNLWKLASGTINLVAGQAPYTMPADLVTLTEVYYTTVTGTGVNSDRIMYPIDRTSYAQITNKLQTGTPSQYWFEMLVPPQITIWATAAYGAPTYVLNWYGLSQMQDANLASGETPDVPRRGLEALCSELAFKLCEKFGPEQPQARQAMMQEKRMLADRAYTKLINRDQETGNIKIAANVSSYARMRR